MLKRRFGQHFYIGLGPEGVAVARAWRCGSRCEVLAERCTAAYATSNELAAVTRNLLAAAVPPGAPVSIFLSDELLRMWLVAPPPSCSRKSDLHAATRLRFKTLFGVDPVGWQISADWRPSCPFIAVAVPQALLSALHDAVRDHRSRLVQLQPQFVVAFSNWYRPPGSGTWFGLLQSNVLTLALFDGRSLAAIRPILVPSGASRAWLDSLIAREALLAGLEQPVHLELFGPAPRSWASEPGGTTFACALLNSCNATLSDRAHIACTGSFRRKRVDIDFAEPSVRRAIFRTPAAAWAMAAAASTMLAAGVSDLSKYLKERERYELALATTRPPAPRVVRAVAPVPAVSREQALAVNVAVMQLNLPWRALHDAVQAASSSSVALLALEPDAKKGLVRITAETKTSEDMIAYLERLKLQDFFSAVTLTQHEINEQDPNHPVRFQLEAQWRQL